MFDIGFSELLVIAVVALIVIGPERLPKVARTLGHLFGRMQRYVNDVKADITREMELEELRKLQASVEDAARSIQSSVNREVTETENELNKVVQAVQPAPEYPADSSTQPPALFPAQFPEASAPKPETTETPASPQLDLALEDLPQQQQPEPAAVAGETGARKDADASPHKQA
jgi:sec-independent protein translocase protein TatB